jgi:predicted nucleic-acid-binding protein
MIGLDTNVIIRYLVQDDPVQSPKATDLIEQTLDEERPGFIALVTMAEVVWVLRECYDATKPHIVQVVEGLLASKQLKVENAQTVHWAVRAYRSSSVDFSDALILRGCTAAGCERAVTFDRKAARLDGFELL